MKIAILGYGLEGKSVERYFKKRGAEIDIFKEFSPDLELKPKKYDYIFRSPSIPLHQIPKTWRHRLTSATRYFFEHCPAHIIGVTGTKGKGTTCTMIKDIFEALGRTTYLVGNIGEPALDFLDQIDKENVVVYELSSFQLWDLNISPDVAVVLRIEPDHLNVHKDFDDYVSAKANIARWQTPADYTVYFKDCLESYEIAFQSPGLQLSYPFVLTPGIPDNDMLSSLLDTLPLPGEHNKENLQAALLAAYACYLHGYSLFILRYSFEMFLADNFITLKRAIKNMAPLPHHIEFVRELKHVKYYDDSFCTVFPALDVALKSFEDQPLVLIAGGSSKDTDLEPARRAIFDHKNLIKAVLIGETAEELSQGEDPEKYVLAGTDFKKAVETAKNLAESAGKGAVVLLSPCAASFDMFKSYKDRGDQFKAIVNSL